MSLDEPDVIEHHYQARGASAKLFRCHAPELLLEGPANTGKSRALCERLYQLCETYPGCRVLMLRKTRKELTDSILVIWESDDVVPPGHECLAGPAATNRHSYRFDNGSEVVLGGLDDPQKTFSAQYDIVALFEATEATENDWELLHRSLRNKHIPHPDVVHPPEYCDENGEPSADKLLAAVISGALPKGQYPNGDPVFFHQAIADCNPAHEHHWLNQRAMDPNRMVRILARFKDNPTVTQQDLGFLDRLKGPRRARLFLGLWVTAEGQIWENWDEAVHVIDKIPTDRRGDSVIEWFFGAIDWGFRNPGVFQVWGVDRERRAYLIHETYHSERNVEWWAEIVAKEYKTYKLRVIACDPSEPGYIDLFNKRLRRHGGHNVALGADNSVKAGLDIVRERLGDSRDGKPSLYILRGCSTHRDPELIEAHQPTGLIQEIPGYVWWETKDGQAVKEIPDPSVPQHSADAMRYAMIWLDWSYYKPGRRVIKDKPGTYGAVLGHEQTWKDIKAGKWL